MKRGIRDEILGHVIVWTGAICALTGAVVLGIEIADGLGLEAGDDLSIAPHIVFLLIVAAYLAMNRGARIAWDKAAADRDAAADATKERDEAKRRQVEAEKEAARATRERDEAKRQQRAAENRREKAMAFALLARHHADAVLVKKADGLTLEHQLHLAVVVGHRQQEGPEKYRWRKASVVEKRSALWFERDKSCEGRYGAGLFFLIEEQGGLCGNPAKDEGGWGCGCWLYALPPGTVHVDHIKPRAHGGTDDPENLQALCHTCNTAKGTRTREASPDAEDDLTAALDRVNAIHEEAVAAIERAGEESER